MKRKLRIIPAALMLACCCGTAAAQSSQIELQVVGTGGSTIWSNPLDGVKRITFPQGNSLSFIDKDGTALYTTDINNVKKLLFYNPTAAGINKPTANNAELSLVVDDDQVSLKGWTAGNIARAVIYSTSGQAFYNEANWDGSAISISSLPKGVYILTVNNNSYKFRK